MTSEGDRAAACMHAVGQVPAFCHQRQHARGDDMKARTFRLECHAAVALLDRESRMCSINTRAGWQLQLSKA
jgi:hypothetical protein